MNYPLPFYLSCLAIMFFAWHGWNGRNQGWGLPSMMVLGTVAAWYVGDLLYNGTNTYLWAIGPESFESAWWQVLLFLIVFGLSVKGISQWMNQSLPRKRSYMMTYITTDRLRQKGVQRKIDQLIRPLFIVWFILMCIGLHRIEWNFLAVFAPYIQGKVDPWYRGQIGGGFSALLSLGSYIQLFLTSAFGVLAALALNQNSKYIALAVCLVAMPYYILDRTRNTMLAAVLPGILAFVFVRMRAGYGSRMLALGVAFLVVNFWFTTVLANRDGMKFDMIGALSGVESKKTGRHEGLNMFEELGWVNHFLKTGEYQPDFGARYIAELCNPIPRGLWKNKPTLGLDYSIARGQVAAGPDGEVTASIATGMIGQGVVNFGGVLGPAAAAVLMALWVGLLARQDLLGEDPGRMILYGCGSILTFNMGRDITLMVLYPFFFGLAGLHLWKFWQRRAGTGGKMTKRPIRRMGANHRIS